MMTLEMAEFTPVELGSMTTSTYMHSTCNTLSAKRNAHYVQAHILEASSAKRNAHYVQAHILEASIGEN